MKFSNGSEGFQMTGERFTAADVPDWLAEAWRLMSFEAGSFYRVDYADGTADSYLRGQDGKAQRVYPDDWILRDENGALCVRTTKQLEDERIAPDRHGLSRSSARILPTCPSIATRLPTPPVEEA